MIADDLSNYPTSKISFSICYEPKKNSSLRQTRTADLYIISVAL